VWGSRRIQEIARRDVIELLDGITDRGTPIAANRTLAAISKLFNWCIERGIVEISPCIQVRRPAVEISRDRVLSDEELGLAWQAGTELGFPFGTLVQLLALTGQRRDEVAGMRWSELAGALWTIPGARTKNGQAQEVPLSRAAQAVLVKAPRIAKSDFILTTNGTAPISGYSKAKSYVDAQMLAIARERAAAAGRNDLDDVQLDDWRLHDLRRTLASGLARLGQPIHVIESVLNHRSGTISGVAAVYNRHAYLEEKRGALEEWGKHVLALAERANG
jgi:integrase